MCAAASGSEKILEYVWKLSDKSELEKYENAISGLIIGNNNAELFNKILNLYLEKFGLISERFLTSNASRLISGNVDILRALLTAVKNNIDTVPINYLFKNLTVSAAKHVKNLMIFIEIMSDYGIRITSEMINYIFLNKKNWTDIDPLFQLYLSLNPNPHKYLELRVSSTKFRHYIHVHMPLANNGRTLYDLNKVVNEQSVKIFAFFTMWYHSPQIYWIHI